MDPSNLKQLLNKPYVLLLNLLVLPLKLGLLTLYLKLLLEGVLMGMNLCESCS
jgi:hypothetical protein